MTTNPTDKHASADPVSKALRTKTETYLKVRADGYTMDRYDKETNKLVRKDVPVSTFEGFIRRWLHDKLGRKTRCGHFRATKRELVYEGAGRNVGPGTDVLAIRLKDGRVVGNASMLPRAGSWRRGTEAPAQRVMFTMNLAMVPFNVFTEAGLDLQQLSIVEQGPEEDFTLPELVWNEYRHQLEPKQIRYKAFEAKKPTSDEKQKILSCKAFEREDHVRNKDGSYKRRRDGTYIVKHRTYYDYEYYDLTVLAKRHFVGAMLLRVKDKYFLFDVDRGELPYYRFNPFLVQLPTPAKTIAEAYESLKPTEVIKALRAGKKVQRQGEWFFIPVSGARFKQPPEAKHQVELSPLRMHGLQHLDTYRSGPITLKELRQTRTYKELLPQYKKELAQRVRAYNKALPALKKKTDAQNKRYQDAHAAHQAWDNGGELRAGRNRPNRAERLYIDAKNGNYYVRGTISHTGREHEDLQLATWHRAVPNTATSSWTITGNVD